MSRRVVGGAIARLLRRGHNVATCETRSMQAQERGCLSLWGSMESWGHVEDVSSSIRCKSSSSSSLPADISAAATRARFPSKWKGSTGQGHETSTAASSTIEQDVSADTARQVHDSTREINSKTTNDAERKQEDVVSSIMFPWEKRQMQGGALSTWEKYYWGVFVLAIAVFLFNRAGHWMSKDPKVEEEERRRKEEIEKQKQDKARRVLIGGSMLEDEDDPFDGLSPQEIEEFVERATGANAKDPFDGMSPEEINEYLATNPIGPLQGGG